MWFARIAEVVDMVCVDVDRRGKFEMIVDLASAEVDKVKLEALEMEDKVIWNLLEAGPRSLSVLSTE
jgi:hypothetical protein